MPPRILPTDGLPYTGAGAEAEQKTVNFLKALPDHYFVLRELRMHPSLEKRRAGSSEDRIDSVVIGTEVGVIILEVKDWNINRNNYEWIDQYNVRKIDERGNAISIRNPYAQLAEYVNAVCELLRSQLGRLTVYVQGFVVFPRLARAEFENRLLRPGNRQIINPQERFLVDLERTLFGDVLDNYLDAPLSLLKQLVKLQDSRLYEDREIIKTVNALVPPKLQVGDLSRLDRGYEYLLLLDKEQQEWAFSEVVKGKNYMLDVAGSGKTNILLSRAMHLADKYAGTPGFRVLVLTYSEALARELVRLLDHKIKDHGSPDARLYKRTIDIRHIEELMEGILTYDLGEAAAKAWCQQVRGSSTSPGDYLEYTLPEKCQDILDAQGERFRQYDYLLVDEVQDFSDFFLDVAMSLLKKRENVFMVGDVSQKLFDRQHNLNDLGLIEERARVRGSYLMYRSPKPIGKLAWSFLRQDHTLVYELREHGYEDSIRSKNTILTQPVFKLCQTREELLKEAIIHILDLVAVQARVEQVLCIGLPDTLNLLHEKLSENKIVVCKANEIIVGERRLVLADFAMSKGLERDYVFIFDIDRLQDGSLDNSQMFAPTRALEQEARRSRIRIFVAMTRAIREVYFYYTDTHNRFARELQTLQQSARSTE